VGEADVASPPFLAQWIETGNIRELTANPWAFYHEKKRGFPGNVPNKIKPMMLKPIICTQYIYICVYIYIYIERVVYENVYEFTIHQCCLAIHSIPVFDGSDQHRNVPTQARFTHSSVSKMGYTDDQSFYTGILHKSGCTSTYIISSPYYGNISPDYLQYPWPETSETNSPTPSAFVSARKAVVLRIALALRHAPAHQLQVATRLQGVAQVVVPRVAGDEDHFLTESTRRARGEGPRESPGVCCYHLVI